MSQPTFDPRIFRLQVRRLCSLRQRAGCHENLQFTVHQPSKALPNVMSGKVRVAKHLSQSATENHIITYQTGCVIIIDFAHYSTKLNQLLTNTKVDQIREVFNTANWRLGENEEWIHHRRILSNVWYRVSLLSSHRALQLYHIEGQHPRGHAVVSATVRTMTMCRSVFTLQFICWQYRPDRQHC